MRRQSDQAGYSLPELMITLGVSTMLATMALVGVEHAVTDARANGAVQSVKALLAEAHDSAIANRRNVEVRFVGTNEIQLHRIGTDGTLTQFAGVVLENRNEFRRFSGMPDTPDGFGTSAAVYFNNAAAPYFFTTEGTFVDAAGLPLSGTVSIGIADQPESAGAVTIFGGTGRINAYRWTGQDWRH